MIMRCHKSFTRQYLRRLPGRGILSVGQGEHYVDDIDVKSVECPSVNTKLIDTSQHPGLGPPLWNRSDYTAIMTRFQAFVCTSHNGAT